MTSPLEVVMQLIIIVKSLFNSGFYTTNFCYLLHIQNETKITCISYLACYDVIPKQLL